MDWAAYRALVPRKAMAEIHETLGRRAADEAKVRFGGDDNHLFFEFGPRLLITRKLTGNFPDYERVLPQDNTNIAKLVKDESKAPLSAWRSLRTNDRERSGCSLWLAK